MDAYTVIGRIGEGAHGVVVRAKHNLTGKTVALKKIPLRRLDQGMPTTALREIKALREINSQHVVRLLDVFAEGAGFVLVCELMLGDLGEMIRDAARPLTPAQVKSYMTMLLSGVAFLHRHHIMHRQHFVRFLQPHPQCHLHIPISLVGPLLSMIQLYSLCSLPLSDCIVLWNCINCTKDAKNIFPIIMILASDSKIFFMNFTVTIPLEKRLTTFITANLASNRIIIEWMARFKFMPFLVANLELEEKISEFEYFFVFSSTPPFEMRYNLPSFLKSFFFFPCFQVLPDASPDAMDLIKKFLIYSTDKRISAKKALLHTYFFTAPLATPVSQMPLPRSEKRPPPATQDYVTDFPIHHVSDAIRDHLETLYMKG
ncbi:cyclin-dependent kinase 20-like [Penaeus monodon]|uniref:cyclin-dependent kinase 20-like n=1 Tax=Penaeus monodon TaxID=6687 RepID=UPI0018A70428|nr:cyclin-dependent kinase 20-like [Penaeus monodon]